MTLHQPRKIRFLPSNVIQQFADVHVNILFDAIVVAVVVAVGVVVVVAVVHAVNFVVDAVVVVNAVVVVVVLCEVLIQFEVDLHSDGIASCKSSVTKFGLFERSR